MDDQKFRALAEAMLKKIETHLEASGVSLEVDVAPGGVLMVEFDNGSELIINQHGAAQEIWVAARSGGFHFRPESAEPSSGTEVRWVDTRSGSELFAELDRLVAEQAD